MDTNNRWNERTPILHPESGILTGSSRIRSAFHNCKEKFYEVIPARYVFAFISFLGFFNVYAMRVNLSVALVAMVEHPMKDGSSFENVACKELLTAHFDNFTQYSNETTPVRHDGFAWDANTQSQILASFFYGYVVTQIPGGIIAEKFGATWLYGMGVLITAVFTLLTPMAARWGVGALIAVRVMEGLGEGVTFPAMHALIGRWVPKNERSRIATMIHTGSPVGTVVSLAVSGYLSSSYTLGGWPMVFYLFGLSGIVWFAFWVGLIHESPNEHPDISKSELQYIESGQDQISHDTRGRTPWCSILTSGPVWALTITHVGYNWALYTLLTELPTYLSNILHFDLKHNGLLSALPYLCQAVMAFLGSWIADKMRSSGRYRITTIRKIMNSVAFFIPCVLIGCVSYVGCDAYVIVTLFVVATAFSGFMYSGFNVTHVDMSPAFAGTLMGITNCIANMTGFLAPRYAGYFIHKGQTIENWSVIFLTTSAIYMVSGLTYLGFASAELQPWGLPTLSAPPTDEEASVDRKDSPN